MLMTRKLEGKMILETLNSTLIQLNYISQHWQSESELVVPWNCVDLGDRIQGFIQRSKGSDIKAKFTSWNHAYILRLLADKREEIAIYPGLSEKIDIKILNHKTKSSGYKSGLDPLCSSACFPPCSNEIVRTAPVCWWEQTKDWQPHQAGNWTLLTAACRNSPEQ